MAQLVKYLTLDFSSRHDLTVHGFKPQVGLCADGSEPAWDSLSLSLSLSLCPSPTCTCARTLSLKINKLKKKRKILKPLHPPFPAQSPVSRPTVGSKFYSHGSLVTLISADTGKVVKCFNSP